MNKTYIVIIVLILLVSIGAFIMYSNPTINLSNFDNNLANGRTSQVLQAPSETFNKVSYKIIRQDGNETFYDVEFIYNRDGTTSILFNFNQTRLDEHTQKYIEEEKVDIKDIEVYEPKADITIYKDTNKSDSTILTKNIINGTTRYTYVADNEIDKYLKFGENSIEIIQEVSVSSNSLTQNITFEPINFSHLSTDSSILYYYSFDNDNATNIYDFTSNSTKDATCRLCPVLNTTSLYGKGYDFNGSTTMINVSDTAGKVPYSTSSLFGTTGGTFSVWARINLSVNGGKVHPLFCFKNGLGNTDCASGGIYVLDGGAFNQVTFVVFDNAYQLNQNGASASILPDGNTWHHFVGVANASNATTYLYVDGINIANDSYNTAGGFLNPIFSSIGFKPGEAIYMNGTLDEFTIYNKALSGVEVNNLYRNQSNRFATQGLQENKQFNISLDNNKVNVTISNVQALLNSNISLRLGQWNLSYDYNTTDLNATANALVGYWNLDNRSSLGENQTFVVDRTGRNNGTVSGNAQPNPNLTGQFAGIYTFDGVTDSIRYSANLLSANLTNFTWVGWVRTGNDVTSYQIIESQGVGGAAVNTGDIRIQSGNIDAYWNGASSFGGRLGTTTLNTVTWYHVAVIFSNNSYPTLYLNGIAEGTTTGTAQSFTGNSWAFRLGDTLYADAANSLQGNLDEVMLFNRSLSESEIKEIYVKGRALWNYTEYNNLTINSSGSGTLNNINLAENMSNILPSYKFVASNNSFYTPILGGTANYSFYFTSGTENNKPIITFVSESPSDVNSTDLLGQFKNYTANYNITDNLNQINISTINFLYKTNSTNNDTWRYVNGTAIYNFTSTSSDSYNYTNVMFNFTITADNVYPSTGNLDPNYMHNTAKINLTIDADGEQVKDQLFNVSNTSQYLRYALNFENTSSSSPDFRILACNSSYTDGVTDSSPFCGIAGVWTSVNGNAWNITINRTQLKVIDIAVTNGKVTSNNITLTPTMYFVGESDTVLSGSWNVRATAGSPRLGATETSATTGLIWSPSANTIDSRLLQYNDSDSFCQIVNASDISGNFQYSSTRCQILQPTAISNTCTYTSSNWNVLCSDGCNITSNVNLLGNNLSITGTGIFNVRANITNFNVIRIQGTDENNICRVNVQNGGFRKNG